MSNVSGLGATPPLTNFASDPNAPPALTPDALLAYCSSRMEAIDTNIQQYFAEQQKKNKASIDAGKLIQIMHQFVDGHANSEEIANTGVDGVRTPEQLQKDHAAMANQLMDLWRHTESPEVRQAAAKAFKSTTGQDISLFGFDPNKTVTPADIKKAADNKQITGVDKGTWDSWVEDVKNVQSDISKGAEMNMIQLQSLISQRQLAVQLTTQLMQKVNEGAKQVCQNI